MKKYFLFSFLSLLVSNSYADQNKIMIAKKLCDNTEKLALIAQEARQDNLAGSVATTKLLNYIDSLKLSEFERKSLTRIAFISVPEAYKTPIFNDSVKRNNVISSYGQYAYTTCLDALNKQLSKN